MESQFGQGQRNTSHKLNDASVGKYIPFVEIGKNTESENRNNLCRLGDLKNNSKRETRWYLGNKAIQRNETGPRMWSDTRIWTPCFSGHSRQMPHSMFLLPLSLWSQVSHTHSIRKPQSIDVWICSWAVGFIYLFFFMENIEENRWNGSFGRNKYVKEAEK